MELAKAITKAVEKTSTGQGCRRDTVAAGAIWMASTLWPDANVCFRSSASLPPAMCARAECRRCVWQDRPTLQEVSDATGVGKKPLKEAYKEFYENRHKLAEHLPDWKDAIEALPEPSWPRARRQ